MNIGPTLDELEPTQINKYNY